MCESCKQLPTLCNTCQPYCGHLYSIKFYKQKAIKTDIMRITLNEPELELEVNRVDTPTGTGWCVIMPDDRKILVKLRYGKWETEDMISEQFVQDVGSEISRFLEEDQPGRVNDIKVFTW